MPLARLRGLKEFRLWYRHELGLNPFSSYEHPEEHCLQVKGEECREPEASKFREWLCEAVKKPRGEAAFHGAGWKD